MSKGTVYLSITDLHWRDDNIQGRVSYRKEQEHAFNAVNAVAHKYKSQGYKVVGLSLGDLNDRDYDKVIEATISANRISYWRTLFDEIYVVLGNHELTYYDENPFWGLFSDMESKNIPKYLSSRVFQPRGVHNMVRVVDELVDGEVRFLFNHYGCPIQKPISDGKKTIGLFHQDLYAKAIIEDIKINRGVDVYEHTPVYFDTSDVLYGYDYCFLAHMHMLYGEWEYVCEQTGYVSVLEFLSTLGRTNHLEISNDFLERNIPAIIVVDGKFVAKEDNKFNLMTREECVIEEIVTAVAEKRKIAKVKKEAQLRVNRSDDPIENIRLSLQAKNKSALVYIFDSLLDKGTFPLEEEILNKVDNIKW
jgi:hypothetical protein